MLFIFIQTTSASQRAVIKYIMEDQYNQDRVQELERKNELLHMENIRISEQAHIDANNQWNANLAHKQSQQRFRTIFENSPIGNKIIDKDLRILQTNIAMVKLLGFTEKNEIIGTRILDYTTTEYIKDWRFLQQQLWSKDSNTFTLESALMRKDGVIIRCRITSILFADQDETLGFTTIEDITDQYTLLKQKEEFISVASHELKTPVTSLKASIQVIHRLISKENIANKALTTITDKALVAVSRMTLLVEDLLNTTRLEQGQLPLNTGWFEFGTLLDSCCSHAFPISKCSLIFNGDRKLQVYGDQYKVGQIIVNLVNNAIKYAPESKEIIINAKQLDKGVKITVNDKGSGIPASAIPHLFERYYRVDTNVNSGPSGLGLGLYISAEIVRRHGGDIGVESTVGSGSMFWFVLPNEAAE